MVTKLDRPLKREILVDGAPYTLTITADGFVLAPKGRRKGYSLSWIDLVSGDAALATALNATLAMAPPATKKSDRVARDSPVVRNTSVKKATEPVVVDAKSRKK
jgi:hypothetical protein